MGLMSGLAGMGAAIESSAGYALRSAMDEQKALRIAENSSRLRVSEEVAKEGRMKAGAAEERTRIAEYSKPGLIQSNPETAAGSGANDILPGADENVGVDVQNRVRAPTAREAVQRATAAGDLQAMTTLGAEANRVENNARADKQQVAQENRWKAEDDKWQRQYAETVRHNKAVEANAAEKLSPAAKAQLDSVTARVSSAQKAELEAAKALEAARKSMADPAAIAQLEGEYRASKAIVQTALTQYDAVGEAHFGDKWKKIETMAPTAPAAPAGVSPQAVEFLMAGKGTPEQFDAQFKLPKGTGAAIIANSKKTGGSGTQQGVGSELSKANPVHREAMSEVADLEKRLAYLKSTDAAPVTLREVQAKLDMAKKKVRALEFGNE